MRHTLGTAAKATGKSKSVIHRAIKTGLISAYRREDGVYEIDPAELHRVFPAVRLDVPGTVPRGTVEPAQNREVELLEREIKTLQDALVDMRHRLDLETQERREAQAKLTALLSHQPQAQPITSPAVRPAFWLALALAVIVAEFVIYSYRLPI